MTPEAQRIAIAEACGWEHWKMGNAPVTALRKPTAEQRKYWLSCGDTITDLPINATLRPDVPDFLNDLNAMAEAVKTLTREQYDADDGFTYYLARIVHGLNVDDPGWNFYELQEATAAQRAEAFLRVKGLWVEG